jgi:hypothetical protein
MPLDRLREECLDLGGARDRDGPLIGEDERGGSPAAGHRFQVASTERAAVPIEERADELLG